MQLERKQLEKYNPCQRSIIDKRRKEAKAVFSYIDPESGHEYRKSFTAQPNTPEIIFWDIAPKTITQNK
jgi:hypothetical protein